MMQMVTIDQTKDWTEEDYLLLGELTTPCQLINGRLIMSPAPNPNHQRISRRLFRLLDKATEGRGELFYAPIDLFVNRSNVFQPDILFISNQNRQFITERGIEGPPELIVEIISPSNSYTDRYQKKDHYQAFGVREYWIVDPANKTLEIYSQSENFEGWSEPRLYLSGTGTVSSFIIPDIKFSLEEVFSGG